MWKCDECGSNNPGQFYTFQYGNKVGSKREASYKRVTVRVAGNKSVYLCSKCIGKYRRHQSIKGGIIVGISVVLLVFAQSFNTSVGSEIWDFIAFAGFIGSLWAGVYYWQAFTGDTYALGISRAIAKHKPDLIKQGYDYFVWDKKK